MEFVDILSCDWVASIWVICGRREGAVNLARLSSGTEIETSVLLGRRRACER